MTRGALCVCTVQQKGRVQKYMNSCTMTKDINHLVLWLAMLLVLRMFLLVLVLFLMLC
jgi:hypothetical protein